MTAPVQRWMPAVILGLTAAATGFREQPSVPALRQDLAQVVPQAIGDYTGVDQVLPADEVRAAGVTSYLARMFTAPEGAWFSVYVGYYERQLRGETIHSPKNCLPGAGWEALTTGFETIETSTGTVTVGRALVQKDTQRVLVLYWYQGRGRVQASEYWVKWDLLRDAVRSGRTDEAVVRIVTPAVPNQERARRLAASAAGAVIPGLFEALP